MLPGFVQVSNLVDAPRNGELELFSADLPVRFSAAFRPLFPGSKLNMRTTLSSADLSKSISLINQVTPRPSTDSISIAVDVIGEDFFVVVFEYDEVILFDGYVDLVQDCGFWLFCEWCCYFVVDA